MLATTVDGRYQVIARVASGGMGEVYRAHDAVLDREVALKVLHSNLASDPGFIDRFRREARAAAMLNHPNIVAVHDWGSTEHTYFMVMEFVRGHSLRTVLSRLGRLEPSQATEVLLQVLAALDHAHTRGIVHRDIKPENILVTPEGVVKVADFGLARALAESVVTHAPGTVTGTVQYLAPEQVQGEPSDPRTDLYALGVVLFELLTGRVPFSGETSVSIAYKHLSEQVPAPSSRNPLAPPSLDEIVLHATQKERERRPQSAGAMRKELVRAATGLPPARPIGQVARDIPAVEIIPDDRAPTVTIPRTLSPRARRKRTARKAFTILAAILMLLGAAWVTWTYAIPHRTHVPDVLGVDQQTARRSLERAGLKLEVGNPRHSSQYPAGLIMAQSKPKGTKTRKGTTIVVVVSLGPEFRKVPSVQGTKLVTAIATLRKAGFVVGARTLQFSDTVAAGLVIEQSPTGGSSLEVGKPVGLVVSKGRRPVTVPNVEGKTEGEAVAILTAANLKVEVKQDFSASVARGTVISSVPPQGTDAHEGDAVTIHVSKGPRQFPMPDVRGMSEPDAEQALRDLGLDVRVVHIPNSSGNNVVGQGPEPGTVVEQGNQVTIYVA